MDAAHSSSPCSRAWLLGNPVSPLVLMIRSPMPCGPLRRPGRSDLVDDAIYALGCSGPALGRPLVDSITASKIRNLKELRPPSSGTSRIRILFAFDPWRSAILLVAGNKEGKWNRWYAEAIPRAELVYEVYLKERAEEEPS
jgi:hypothetical protein